MISAVLSAMKLSNWGYLSTMPTNDFENSPSTIYDNYYSYTDGDENNQKYGKCIVDVINEEGNAY